VVYRPARMPIDTAAILPGVEALTLDALVERLYVGR
jgi:hypothetical protein